MEKKIDTKFKHNWVGAQCYNSEVICIPNDENRLLKTDNEFLGAVADDELFKWTGGTIWDNKYIVSHVQQIAFWYGMEKRRVLFR